MSLKYERLDNMRIFETQSGLTRLLICMLYDGLSDVTRVTDEARSVSISCIRPSGRLRKPDS